jgi:hypothetical protein
VPRLQSAIAGNVFRFSFTFDREPSTVTATVQFTEDAEAEPIALTPVVDADHTVIADEDAGVAGVWAYYADFDTTEVVDYGEWIMQARSGGAIRGAREKRFIVREPVIGL